MTTYNIEYQSSDQAGVPIPGTRRSRSSRVLLILVGILLALNILGDPISMDAAPIRYSGYDAIRLRSQGDILVKAEIELPHERLFGGVSTGAVWGDTHIWGHMQRIHVANSPAYVSYFEFRSEEDAASALSQFEDYRQQFRIPLESQVFSRFLVIVQGPHSWGGAKVLGEDVFSAIADPIDRGQDY